MDFDAYGKEQTQGLAGTSTSMMNAVEFIPPTDRQRLMEKKRILTNELKAVDDALEMLNEHPELEKFTKVLQRGLGR